MPGGGRHFGQQRHRFGAVQVVEKQRTDHDVEIAGEFVVQGIQLDKPHRRACVLGTGPRDLDRPGANVDATDLQVQAGPSRRRHRPRGMSPPPVAKSRTESGRRSWEPNSAMGGHTSPTLPLSQLSRASPVNAR